MTAREYPNLGEKVYWKKLSNGLTVAVLPKSGFSRKLAYFVTDFGSIHTKFEFEGQTYEVPAGIAHYLEHKMFDLPDRDVSAEFAELGAGVNAFTSYDMTAYYFYCTEGFSDCLKLLLEFVSVPYFTQESVDKERGIIDQEIGMNVDAPETVVFENLMEGVYANHNIRQPILGTCETIRQITPELLYLCHRAFYTPGNMILCVVGDVDPEEVERIALEQLGEAARSVGKKIPTAPEEMTCPVDYREQRMEVAMPTFQMAFKCESVGMGEDAIRQEVIGDLAAEALFGESSALYMEMYEKGIIDASFGGGFETVDGCAMLSCGGDSDEPLAVRDAILARVKELAAEGVDEGEFMRMKRSAMGRRLRDLDSFESVCFRTCAYHFSNYDYFRFPEAYESVTAEEIRRFLEKTVTPERCGVSVITPVNG